MLVTSSFASPGGRRLKDASSASTALGAENGSVGDGSCDVVEGGANEASGEEDRAAVPESSGAVTDSVVAAAGASRLSEAVGTAGASSALAYV